MTSTVSNLAIIQLDKDTNLSIGIFRTLLIISPFMLMRATTILLLFVLAATASMLSAQSFYFGADLSYVNEMEDCGVQYQEQEQVKDPYLIFAEHGCNLVRLRLWHSPAWYDELNGGDRYSDLADVKRSITRAKEAGMQVLLDFHLSDNWADPGKQIVPAAWEGVVNDLPALQDSLYNYVFHTLMELHDENLWPDIVQIGNETNRGILLTQEENDEGWTLDWTRNSSLFNKAIQGVREAEEQSGDSTLVALHLAGPANVEWFVDNFWENGVTDFDVIGMSFYWAWHQPTTIQETGEVIMRLREDYPGKEVMIFETGYIWTTDYNDAAANIISETHPDYSPPSPQAQKAWLVDLTQQVVNSGGLGVVYWEPAWVSSPCWTQWGQGSHQEHATFFDFNSNLMEEGGMSWMQESYSATSIAAPLPARREFTFTALVSMDGNRLTLLLPDELERKTLNYQLIHLDGKHLQAGRLSAINGPQIVDLPDLSNGLYFIVLEGEEDRWAKQKVVIARP